jgi:hypothetical protein
MAAICVVVPAVERSEYQNSKATDSAAPERFTRWAQRDPSGAPCDACQPTTILENTSMMIATSTQPVWVLT